MSNIIFQIKNNFSTPLTDKLQDQLMKHLEEYHKELHKYRQHCLLLKRDLEFRMVVNVDGKETNIGGPIKLSYHSHNNSETGEKIEWVTEEETLPSGYRRQTSFPREMLIA